MRQGYRVRVGKTLTLEGCNTGQMMQRVHCIPLIGSYAPAVVTPVAHWQVNPGCDAWPAVVARNALAACSDRSRAGRLHREHVHAVLSAQPVTYFDVHGTCMLETL